jgi:hypothetical protein
MKTVLSLFAILLLVHEFSCAADLLVIERNGKAGYVDSLTWKEVIPPQFEEAQLFSQGRAAVKQGGKWGFIDSKGSMIIPPSFDSATSFSEGLAAVKLELFWGFINTEGITKVPFRFSFARSFSTGVAPVREGDQWTFITQTGGPISGSRYDNALSFSEGLAAVKIGSKWGYINREEKTTIEPQYSFAESFSEGRAVVRPEGLLNAFRYINSEGKVVIESTFMWAKHFSQGLAPVQASNELWGYIDTKGTFAIAPQFANAEPFLPKQESPAVAEVLDIFGHPTYINQQAKKLYQKSIGVTGKFAGLQLVDIVLKSRPSRAASFLIPRWDWDHKTYPAKLEWFDSGQTEVKTTAYARRYMVLFRLNGKEISQALDAQPGRENVVEVEFP